MREGRDEAAVSAFFDELGPARTAGLETIGTDGAARYIEAIGARAPETAVCIDPSTCSRWPTALDDARRSE